MSKNIQKEKIDITGIKLTPGEPTVCLGNGEQGFECCCDECDFFLCCFPEFDPKSREGNFCEANLPRSKAEFVSPPVVAHDNRLFSGRRGRRPLQKLLSNHSRE